jgi:hypothetical protein
VNLIAIASPLLEPSSPVFSIGKKSTWNIWSP